MNILFFKKPKELFRPMKNIFLLTACISSCLSIYFSFFFITELIFSIIVSIITIVLIFIYKLQFENNPNSRIYDEILLCILMIILIFHLPSYYLSTSRITYKMKKMDESILRIDSFLLDWIFKNGQLSLYLDENKYIGPHTTIGQLINNILQIFYFFYYIIPYIILYGIFLANCIKEIIFRYQNKGQKSFTYYSHWKNAFFIFGIYNLTYSFVFFINSFIPAGSPRKYLENQYSHSLKFSGFAKFLNDTCKDDKSANSFPSGHVAETMCIAFAYLGMGKKKEGALFFFCSIMIALATLILRYHYFSDVLCAVSISGFCFYFNYVFGYIQKEKEEEKTEKNQGKQLVKEVEKKEYVPSMLELPRFNVKEKENNPLDALPPSKFDLEKFKKDFLNNSNKKSAMKKFWKEFDPEGYSIWYIEYKNEPSEFITLFRTVIVKGDILYQLKYFKKYCFGVLGVYGSDGDYKIRGCLMWKGKEIPDEIKEIHCYNKLK